MFDFRCPYGSITAIISNCLDYYFGFCCSCALLLLATSHEVMENAEMAPFDVACIVEQTSCGPDTGLGADSSNYFFKENSVLILLS